MKTDFRCFILVPGLSEKFRTGGLMVLQDLQRMFRESGMKADFIATHEKHSEALAPDAVKKTAEQNVYIVSWGPLVHAHIKLIKKYDPGARIVYYAQSFGWGIKLPHDVPIVSVSRYVMAQWALQAPHNEAAFIPPVLSPQFTYKNQQRDIDILVHTRKQNSYCLETLVPALEKENIHVEKITDWISQDEFAAKLQRTKLFLYITAPHKAGIFRILPGEGFGLPAAEAVACGAVVGSNLLGGVTDFLTPGENAIKLGNSLELDLHLIKERLKNWHEADQEEESVNITQSYNREKIKEKWHKFFQMLLENPHVTMKRD